MRKKLVGVSGTDLRLCGSVLQTAPRASVGASRLGANFRPLSPEIGIRLVSI